jgi:hypothetical protein
MGLIMESILHNFEEHKVKMPIYICACGLKILILPDTSAMNSAIKNHLKEHKKLTGKKITEEKLTNDIIGFLSKHL